MSNANNYDTYRFSSRGPLITSFSLDRIVLHNNMMGMQMPMFAPANQQTTGDEVDLQEIFADYLTEDYSLPDPTSVSSAQQQQVQQQLLAAQQHQQLAANAMAAQAQAAAQQQQHQQHQQLSLPTRQGIKTAWHTGSLPTVQQQQGRGGSQGNGMQQQGQPPAKKMRGEELYLPSEPVQQQQQTHQHQHQQQMGQKQQMENGGGEGSVGQHNQSVTTGGGGGMGRNNVNAAAISMAHQQQQWALAQAASGYGGLSSRLGFTLPNNGTAVVDMGSNNTVVVVQQQQQQQQQHLPMQQQQQQQQGVMLPLGGIHFPVGIGLKFGTGGTVVSQVGSMADPTTAVNNHVVNSNIAAMSNNLALALSEGAVNGSDTRLAVSNMQYGVNPMSFPPSSNHLQQPQQPLQPFGIMRQECEEQLASERRLRNREHAKRSRVRKKFMLESLQLQVRGLQDENSTLRMLVQQHIPHEALNIIDTCCSKSVLFADPMGGLDDDDDEGNNNTRRRPQDQNGNKTKDESDDTATKSPSPTPLLRSDFSLIESLTSGQQNFVLSDPRLPDNPIVYASSGFYELTGYTREQVLGRNCRFLQGSGTSRKAVDILRTAVANGTDATVCLLNYKADGTPFWNQLFVAALRDGDNCIVNYVGVQTLIEPNAGATALEDKVNAAHPILVGTEEDGDYDKDQVEED
ncbi:hypothetical protein ACHAXH_004092 [Discostella pseudostelligera]